ncbi:Filamin-A [Liparis tanakae]|uniref:Filamin-A n=1 Tax=Liparis tanakae TaxID=230148 RepID=A0A4Z2EHJ5_9TELE|nr:Filamin-A [Liparis tanakae]
MSAPHPRLHQSAAPAANAPCPDKDAEMPATEKDLAEDAPWKKIQQNTFTRWCNEHLKCVNKRLGNLQTDLGDGLRLIGLLEVLSQKKMFRKYNQRPTFRQMQLENVSSLVLVLVSGLWSLVLVSGLWSLVLVSGLRSTAPPQASALSSRREQLAARRSTFLFSGGVSS